MLAGHQAHVKLGGDAVHGGEGGHRAVGEVERGLGGLTPGPGARHVTAKLTNQTTVLAEVLTRWLYLPVIPRGPEREGEPILAGQ